MQNAYDIQVLIAKAKTRGLDLTEDAAKGLIEDVVGWLSDSAIVSANPIDNVLLAIYPLVKQFALAQADKIDGQVG